MACFLIVSTSDTSCSERPPSHQRVRGPLSILPQLFNSSFSKLNSKGLIKSEAPSGWIRCLRFQCSAGQELPWKDQWVSYTANTELASCFSASVKRGQSKKMAISKQEEGFHQTLNCLHLDLILPSSKTVRNKLKSHIADTSPKD